jgi:hypothetical protein
MAVLKTGLQQTMRKTVRDKKYDYICEFIKNILSGKNFLLSDDGKKH